MDTVNAEHRSRIMAAIKQKDTKPEITVRRLLHAAGYRFRLHRKSLPGCPDIVLPRYHTVVFVHGCFWHRHPGCSRATTPKSNTAFWTDKFEKNLLRDKSAIAKLLELGWNVVIVWECEIVKREELLAKFEAVLKG